MTIAQLYSWAKENNLEDADLKIRDSDGCYTYMVEPVPTYYKSKNGSTYADVEL